MDQRGSLNDPEFADIYVQRIDSNGVSPIATVNYEAQNSISLNPGIESKTGVIFKAEVKQCIELKFRK